VTPAHGGVVVVHPSDEMYGADRVLLEVVDVLGGDGDVQVWLPTDVPYPRHELSRELVRRGVPVHHTDLPVLRRAYLRAGALPALARRAWRTHRRLRQVRPGLVYLNTSASLVLAPAARAVGARVVVHVHESWSRLERLVLGPFLRSCDTVLAVSAAVAEQLPLPAERVTVLHNGFPRPQARHDGTALRASVGAEPTDVVALVASRWNGWKGHEVLLDAWSRLGRDDAHLVVLGGPPPSGAAVDVARLAAALPPERHVHVVGETDDVASWVAAADVVLVPSTRPDPLPTIAIEAAAAGRAVLASDSGGLPDIVADGVTGRLVRTGDAGEWHAALSALSRDDLVGYGRAAARRFDDLFTRDAFRARLRDALDGTRPRAAALRRDP
jgi:glycosyltransferase involved in cell wall biosynthesis